MTPVTLRQALFAATACCALTDASAAKAATADNVILFVADGASWGTYDMSSYWEHGELGQQPYDTFDVKLGMTTHPAGAPDYDPVAAWDTTPVTSVDGEGNPNFFAGYETIKQNATDSAAAGTALA